MNKFEIPIASPRLIIRLSVYCN